MINVGFDCDGVIFNFGKAYDVIIREMCPFEYPPFDDSQVLQWDWGAWHPAGRDIVDEAWEKVATIENFWEKLEVLDKEQVDYAIDRLNNHQNINVFFITARCETRGHTMLRQTINSLKRIGWTDPQVIPSHTKGPIARSIGLTHFIDDKIENSVEVSTDSPATKTYILHKPYNQVMNYHIKRVKRLEHFVNDVLKAANR